jgi:CRP-like cAMP-binding protein
MSTETKPLKLMPHTRRVGSNGQLLIEPGSRTAFELPPQFRPLFEILEQGASLAKLVDQIRPSQSGPRFRLIKKFLIFLDEHDMLADRDYVRLAESLTTEYKWPTSILTTDLADLPIKSQKRTSRSKLLSHSMTILTVALALGSLALTMWIKPPSTENEPSLIRALLFFLFTFSFTRTVQAFWAALIGSLAGRVSKLDLVIEPVSIRFRQEQNGKSLPVSALATSAISFLMIFGLAILVSRFAQTAFEFDVILIAGAFAFFTETSPYSRSSMTDLLRSLYSNFEERTHSSSREQAIRRVHITACVSWVLFLGIFLAVDVSATLFQTWSLLRSAVGPQKVAGFGILALLLLFAFSWLADLIGSISYDEASTGQIRRLWRQKKETTLDRVRGVVPSASDLERLPFLRQIPAEVRKSLLLAAQVRVFGEGQAICRQGDKDRNLFVVLEGRLAVARTSKSSGGQSRRKVVAWLDPGAVFGENAFFFGQPRTADIVGMDQGRVLVLPHTKDMSLVESERSDELKVRIWFLQALVQSEFFRELPSESLDSILHAGVEQRFAAGTKIIQEGETADACYFMVQGRASVTQKTRAVGKINTGDAFGEISILFPGTLRTATVIADTDLITIRIDQEKFSKLLKAHLPLALEIERLGLRRLNQDKARG